MQPFPGRNRHSAGVPPIGGSAADVVESFSYDAAAAAGQGTEPPRATVLTHQDELERAAAQLATVFPGFLSVAHSAATESRHGSTDAAGFAPFNAAPPDAAPPDASDEEEFSAPVESQELWQQGWHSGLAQGREEGMLTAREAIAHEERASADATLEAARRQVLQSLDAFHTERERYFHDIEQEAVRLALAIAARILRREAQMDPLLLSGAVRVALGQLGESTSVRLLVPEADRMLWEESLRLTPGLRLRPEVIGDARMELGECRIQTEFGGADLSLHEQLREIERGFFDRVPQRTVAEAAPAATPKPASRVASATPAETIGSALAGAPR